MRTTRLSRVGNGAKAASLADTAAAVLTSPVHRNQGEPLTLPVEIPETPTQPENPKTEMERLTDRYDRAGVDGCDERDILALVLAGGYPSGRDTRPHADAVIRAFGSVRRAVESDACDLIQRAGLSPRAARTLKAAGDLWRMARRDEVKRGRLLASPSDVALYVREELGDRPREHFLVMYLDHRNHILSCCEVNEGTVDHAAVYPREILKQALTLNATGLILAHNHPAGSLSPSEADRSLTRQIQEAARAMGVTVHDHLIVASEGSFSFRQAGIL